MRIPVHTMMAVRVFEAGIDAADYYWQCEDSCRREDRNGEALKFKAKAIVRFDRAINGAVHEAA